MTDWKTIAPQIAVSLKGEPKTKTPTEWRWGNKGSFALYLERGSFFDFEDNVGGGAVQMVMHELGIDKPQASEWLRDKGWLQHDNARRNKPPTRTAPSNTQAKTDRPRDYGKRDYGLALWNNAAPIPNDANHPVHKWWTRRRLFRNPEQPIDDCYMRFHQENQLILCPIMTFTSWQDQYPFDKPIRPQAIHAIAIDRDGNKRKPFGDRDKSTYGKIPNASGVLLIGNPAFPRINLCEGIADALFVQDQTWHTTIATITTVAKLAGDKLLIKSLADREVHIYSDQDRAGINASEKLKKALFLANPNARVIIHTDSTAKDPAERAELEGEDVDDR